MLLHAFILTSVPSFQDRCPRRTLNLSLGGMVRQLRHQFGVREGYALFRPEPFSEIVENQGQLGRTILKFCGRPARTRIFLNSAPQAFQRRFYITTPTHLGRILVGANETNDTDFGGVSRRVSFA